MDGASNNDVMVRKLAETLLSDAVHYNLEHRRLRCNGHIINLAVQAFLLGKTPSVIQHCSEDDGFSASTLAESRRMGPLGKLHNIVVYIMSSPQRIQSFKKLDGGALVQRDNSTRCNLWYNILHWSLTKIKPAIQQYVFNEPGLEDDIVRDS